MSKGTILAVDDDAVALAMLTNVLEDAEFEVVQATDGRRAMEALREDSERFDAVVLDWIMPNMNGLDVLRAISADMRFVGLPVIMQTSVTDDEQIKEAIQSGAYYYVTKPYDEETLIGVVQGALEKFIQFREVMSWGIEATAGLALMTRGEFHLRSLQEGRMVSNLIADLAERQVPVVCGLMELITNAVENGNLGVNGSEKAEFVARECWAEEVKRRIYLPENLDKFVSVRFEVLDQLVRVEVEDQGQGFDWTQFVELDVRRAYDVHGRGISMAKSYSFDSLDYQQNGRLVCVSFAAA